jgi:ubiquinone/menaquinone biosynthesis C-methylase UbiE
VLEHVRDDGAALAEMGRVVAPGGQVLIMAPTLRDWEKKPTTNFARADYQGHWRIYGCDLLDRLRAINLEPAVVQLARDLSSAERERLAVRPELLFVARKLSSAAPADHGWRSHSWLQR